ncbi:gustatory receptor 5a for trehalose-like [Haliotis asinina]|uniref:gustatory receptor 5a for trehalose-like n=1 Tax=Haliotis asinina TaxID=109174 RepID=UPI003531A9A7
MARVTPKKRERIVIVREREVVGIERDRTLQAWTTGSDVNSTVQQEGFHSLPNKPTNDDKTFIDCYDGCSFFEDLRPLFWSLKLTGLFFHRRETSAGKFIVSKWVVLCAAVCAVTLGNSLRSLFVFKRGEPFDEVLFFKVQLCIWSVEGFAKTTVMFVASYKKELLPLFFKLWREICKDKKPDKFLKFVMRNAIMISWNFSIVNTIGVAVTFFFVPDLEDLFLNATLPGAAHADVKLPYKIMMIVLVYFASSVAVSSVTLLVVLSVAVTREFFVVNKDLSSQISSDGKFTAGLEDYRLRHQGLCRVVDVLDDIFMIMIAFILISNIPLCCVILYNLIYTSRHFSILLLNLFWLFFLTFHMTVVAVICAYINMGAHAPLSIIYNIKAEFLKERPLELTMFLNRLTGNDIGLSALKMFVINRPAILTMIGMLITYFVLLVQFKSPFSSNCTCSLNSTGATWNGTLTPT